MRSCKALLSIGGSRLSGEENSLAMSTIKSPSKNDHVKLKVSLIGSNPSPWNPEDPDDEDLLTWVGGYFNPASFDPNRINVDHLWRKKW